MYDSCTCRRLAIPLLGAFASLLLHLALLVPVLLGRAAPKIRARYNEITTPSLGSNESSSMTAEILVESDPGESRRRLSETLASLPTSIAPLVPVTLAHTPPAPVPNFPDDQDDSDTLTLNNDDPRRVALFGRYVVQIDARVQRAWIRPRRPIASGVFACRVRIVQEHSGDVKEIELVSCNGDIAWQTSLVRAIQTASPLPAPPDPDVFSSTLILDFRSQPFSPEAGPEGFEPDARTAAK